MNYHNITSPDMLNGNGLRTVLWVSGCTHHCKGCHNPETHKFTSGVPFDYKAYDELMEKCAPDYISGITFSGGDPMMPQNVSTIADICRSFKEKFPNKTIWIWTGFTFEQLLERTDKFTKFILSQAQVIVDGEFILELKDPTLKFRGSSNQRIIDVQESLKQNKIIEFNV